MNANRPLKDTRSPCAICGWSKHMAIHRPLISGPRIGQPWGHEYQPPVPSASDSLSEGMSPVASIQLSNVSGTVGE